MNDDVLALSSYVMKYYNSVLIQLKKEYIIIIMRCSVNIISIHTSGDSC